MMTAEMKPTNLEDLYELSPVQQGFLFHCLFAPEDGVYLEQLTFTFNGPLNIPVFERSWQAILDRHPSLRTAFYWEGLGKPLQAVYRCVVASIEKLDWKNLNATDQNHALDRYLLEDRKRGFNLSQAPLIRFTLIQTAKDQWKFLFRFHHLISDGWSMGLILQEFVALYKNLFWERSPVLPPCRPYRDYITWQKQQDLKSAELFWCAALEGIKASPSLDLGSKPPEAQEGQASHGMMDAQLQKWADPLQAIARRHQLTANTVVQGTWSLLLSRLTGEEDVVAGVTVAGRSPELQGSETIVGVLLNTLPVRTRVPRQDRALQWLKEFQGQQMRRQQFGYASLVQIQEWSEVPSRTPLFETLVVYENVPFPKLHLEEEGLEIPDARYDGRPHYPISLMVFPGLSVRATYLRTRHSQNTMRRILRHLEVFLATIIADPDQRIGDLPLLTREEQQQLLEQWNSTGVQFPHDKCIHELFAEQAMLTPKHEAVSFQGSKLTYEELNLRSNQCAHYLRKRGVGPERAVGIYMERSLEMIVGLLGILKAGGIYVPLDPSYPPERLGYMLRDSRIDVLITQECLLSTLPPGGWTTLCMDASWNLIHDESQSNPPNTVGPENLAYVIYTSGSTGTPKGAAVPHRAVVRLVKGTDYVQWRADNVFLQLAPISFDASTLELWGCLLNGGRLVVFPPGTPDLHHLGNVLRNEAVSILWLTAGLFHQMVEQELDSLAGVRELLAGGDVLSPADVKAALNAGCQVINGYGPTENTTFTCCYRIPKTGWPSLTVPIGKPIANTWVYVLDEEMQAVPVGVVGELYIGGVGLARGYVKQAALTAEKFVPNTYPREGSGGGERLYRTGDRGRYLEGGEIEFLGRRDDQVKVRGYRIELGEIESVLQEHEGVEQAVVVVREEGGEKRLVAYVVRRRKEEEGGKEEGRQEGREEKGGGEKEWRRYLQGKLPEYMVPNWYVELDEIPLTANGKVDRKALPEPTRTREGREREDGERLRGLSQEEEILSGIWEQVLGMKGVGGEENFFELGGHSLLATQVISRIRSAFGVELPLRALFSAPTVKGLAGEIQKVKRGEREGRAVVSLRRRGLGERVQASFAQERLWFLAELEKSSRSYNMPGGLRLRGRLDTQALERSFQEIVRRHESLRTRFEAVDGVPQQVMEEDIWLKLPVEEMRGVGAEERVAAVLREEAGYEFDLRAGRLLRVRLLRLGEEEHVLSLVMHHIISDGWSINILRRELERLYAGYVKGEEVELETLPVSYADYGEWQREWLQGEVLEEDLKYWREKLAGAPAVLGLAGDRVRPAVQSQRGELLEVELSSEVSEGLQGLSQREGVTLFMLLLGVWQVLLHRYSGEEDISVGVPVAGRSHEEVEGLIGLFVNTLVMRGDLSGKPSFRTYLQRVRDTVLEAHGHQELPFEKLVAEMGVERSLSYPPLFQTMFAFQNAEWGWKLLGLEVERLPLRTGTAKFDLMLNLGMREGGMLGGMLEYSMDLYERSTAVRMKEHLEALLEAVLADVQQPIQLLELMRERERRQVIEEWNRTGGEYEWKQCVHWLVEEQATRSPEAPAVTYEKERLSYKELNERANQLAHYLRSHGVGPDVAVGVAMERSLEMVVALLGILKAGGAFVPLDPDYPVERLQYMVKEVKPAAVLTQGHVAEKLSGLAPGKLVCVDKEWEKLAEYRRSNSLSGVGAGNMAYVIYTSGSTGQPKGVMVEHGAITNRLLWMKGSYGLCEKDKVVQKTPYSFDVSVWEFFCPLVSGACLVMARPGGHKDPEYLVQLVEEEQLTIMHFVPSMLQMFLEGEGVERCRSLRSVICSGEALGVETQEKFFSRLTCSLHNLYGPTEAAVEVTSWRCSEGETANTVPIGKPITNLQMYVLDEEMQAAPVGVVGELYIGGVGLARGYVKQAALTAEKFVPNPYPREGSGGGERLYRTGDRGRYLEGGEIEFLGRRDDQVKVRGYRIEPGEIESVLREHEGVEQAVVVVREEGGEKRLVAYVVRRRKEEEGGKEEGRQEGREEKGGGEKEWRRYLQGKLPEYMVPNWYVELDEIPLTANGKVNRKALPKFEGTPGDNAYVPPRDHIELRLIQTWEDLFKTRPIGSKDNFFDLGGHSLLALRLASRVRHNFGYELSLSALFRNATVESLAGTLRQQHGSQIESSLVPIQTGGATLPLFLVHPIAGNVICYVDLARHLGANQSFYGLEAAGLTAKLQPFSRLTDLAAHYIREIKTVSPHGPYILGGWSFGGVVAFEMAQQLLAQNEKVSALLVLDSWAPLARNKPAELDDVRLMVHFATILAAQAGRKPDLTSQEIQAISPEKRFDYVCERAKNSDILPPDIDVSAIRDLYFNVFRRNIQAAFDYEPQPYPERLTLMRASAKVDAEVLQPLADPLHGWDELAPGRVEVYDLPGDHFTIVREPHVRVLAECIRNVIKRSVRENEQATTA